ncbi:hypothetical protein [Edaphobacter acidisoli]|uniref:hypothetical protein n=1 Tax=Edaphobacter acidisoli TaxID=2040573 RepID=UPI00166DB733|nr:hypothetical protein [Edaphobacter acidisoli]
MWKNAGQRIRRVIPRAGADVVTRAMEYNLKQFNGVFVAGALIQRSRFCFDVIEFLSLRRLIGTFCDQVCPHFAAWADHSDCIARIRSIRLEQRVAFSGLGASERSNSRHSSRTLVWDDD